MPTLIHATRSVCVMFSPSKNLWKSTIGSPGRFRFHWELDVGSVSLRFDTARLYRAQFAFSSRRFEPTTVCRGNRRGQLTDHVCARVGIRTLWTGE